MKRADNLAQSPEFRWTDKLSKMEALANEIVNDDCFTLSALKIGGNDLILLGFMGREIGITLNLLLNEVIEEKIENEKNALINRAKEIRRTKNEY